MLPFKVVSTLGPASLRPEFIRRCLELGAPWFRLNGSHLSETQLATTLQTLDEVVSGGAGNVYLDLQGGKRRIGRLARPRRVSPGDAVELGLDSEETSAAIPVPHADVFEAAEVGDRLVLQDGQATLRVQKVSACSIEAKAELGAVLRGGCGLHIDGKSLILGRIPPEQTAQIRTAAACGVGHLALSYVQRPSDLAVLREHCEGIGYQPRIVAKLERPEALQALPAICGEADEVWLCRGDLGSIIPLRELGAAQDEAMRHAAASSTPLLVAGQVFHHLTEHDEPTRSEVVHLHAIRKQGAAGIVLSDETAIGHDPVAAVGAVVGLL